MSGHAEDRLSSLPDELLHQILSFLPSINLVVQTSVLSKRWRHVWVRHHNFRFFMPCPESDYSESTAGEVESIAKSYVLAVDRCLRSFNPPSLDHFEIDLWLPTPSSQEESKLNYKVANRWLRFAGLRSVNKLSVEVRTEPGARYGRLPSSIFSCRALTELDVCFSAFPEVPRRFHGFRNLTKLAVGGPISNQAVSDLLHGCPLLEDLRLIACAGLTYVKISGRISPRLKQLRLASSFMGRMEVRIEAPNLRLIIFSGSVSLLDWERSLALDEAEVYCRSKEDIKSFSHWMNTVFAVSNVSVLKVNYWFYQFAIPKNWFREPLFNNLRELHCNIKWITGSVLRSLTCSLRECPLLERFMISLDCTARSVVKDSVRRANNDDPEGILDTCGKPFTHKDALVRHVEDVYEEDEWNPFEHPSESDYYLHHLKIVTVEEFIGSKNEMHLLGFLLAKAVVLKQFIVFDLLWRNEADLHEVFAGVPRASAHLSMRLSRLDNLEDKFFKRIFA